jgi:hypothetical protein
MITMDPTTAVIGLLWLVALSLLKATSELLDWMRASGRPPRWYFHLHRTARTELEGGYLRRHCRCGGWRWYRNGWINPDSWPARRWRRSPTVATSER